MKFILILLFISNVYAVEFNQQLISAGSMGSSLNSSPMHLGEFNGYSCSAVVSSGSSPVGTLKLQVANDFSATVSNWVDVAGSGIAITGDGANLWSVADAYYKWVRVVYTRTSGSGTLDVNCNIKNIAVSNK